MKRSGKTSLKSATRLFYAQGVKANVLSFDRKPGRSAPWTEAVWVYDFRANMGFTLKTTPLGRSDLGDFVGVYKPDARHERVERTLPALLL